MLVAFYITGHGFGHATRSSEVIHALLRDGHRVFVVASPHLAKSFIINDLLEAGAEVRESHFESNFVQTDPVVINRTASFKSLRDMIANDVPRILEQEIKWLKSVDPAIVCLDSPFLPARAAKRAGYKAIYVTNFTFDSIFTYIAPPADKEVQADLEFVASCYRDADFLLRLPGHIVMPAFTRPEHKVDFSMLPPNTSPSQPTRRHIQLPLVVRQPRHGLDVHATFNIPRDQKILLVSFGGHSLTANTWKTEELLPPGWVGLVSDREMPVDDHRLIFFEMSSVFVPDLLSGGVDAVLGKCGYGMCAEVVAAGLPFIYVPRPDFAEEHGLVRMLDDYGVAIRMEQTDFYGGVWKHKVEEVWTLREQLMVKKGYAMTNGNGNGMNGDYAIANGDGVYKSKCVRPRLGRKMIHDNGAEVASEMLVRIANEGLDWTTGYESPESPVDTVTVNV
ncbi:hypothetical protein BJ742DRAFT_841401 [Cladochytrium replicatum]|nr:hypothetical protein BJ742DRAFT_841401 [Cladochytrium replicatum]